MLEDILLQAKENNYLMSFCFDEQSMAGAFAAADISTGEFFVSECSPETFEAEISKYKSGEIIISSQNF